MKRNWLSGVVLMVAMLACSVSFADVNDTGMYAAPIYDTVVTVDTGPPYVLASMPSKSPSAHVDWRIPGGNPNYYIERIKGTWELVTACAWQFEPVTPPTKIPIAI